MQNTLLKNSAIEQAGETRQVANGHKRARVTAIEFLLVVAVLAVVSAIALVKYTIRSGTHPAKTAIQAIKRDIHQARELAKTLQQPIHVIIEPDKNEYRITDAAGTILTDRHTGNPFKTTLGSGRFKGVAITATDFSASPLRFDETGTPHRGSTPLMQNETVMVLNDHVRIDIEPGTGKLIIEIYEDERR